MKNILLTASVLFFSCLSYSETNTKKTVDLSSQESKVEFLAIGKPSMLKINGTGGKINGQVEIENNLVKGTLRVPLRDLTTGISLRDEHMKKKYLETAKFPEALLEITDFKMEKDFLKNKGRQKNIPFKGKLKIHGVEKEISGSADLDSDDKALVIIAKANTKMTNHNIDLPSYLGIKVADDVAITTELKIKK